jgi:hypothetical protein
MWITRKRKKSWRLVDPGREETGQDLKKNGRCNPCHKREPCTVVDSAQFNSSKEMLKKLRNVTEIAKKEKLTFSSFVFSLFLNLTLMAV